MPGGISFSSGSVWYLSTARYAPVFQPQEAAAMICEPVHMIFSAIYLLIAGEINLIAV
jgi:hypothetical protein